MKVKLQKTNDILMIPDEFAFLDNVSFDKFFYKIVYQIDPAKAAKSNAFKVILSAISKQKDKRTSPVFDIKDPATVIRSLTTSAARTKDSLRSGQSNVISTYNSDSTSKIPNSIASGLKTKSSISVMNKTFKLTTMEDMRKRNVEIPVLTMPTVTPPELSSDQLALKESCLDLLLNKQDPSMVATRNRFQATATACVGGILQKQTKINFGNKEKNKALVYSFINQNQNNYTPDTVIPVQIIENSNLINVEEIMEITGPLPGEFFLEYRLVDKNGLTIETVTRTVQHGKNLAIFLVPKLPPIVKTPGVNSTNKTSLEITQVDKNAVGVKIYRKAIQPFGNNTDSKYSFVNQIPLTVTNGRKTFVDNFPNHNPVIYRVIPFGVDEVLSSEFTGVVSKAPGVSNGTAHDKPKFASLVPYVENDNIRIELLNLSTGPIAAQLFKQDVSIPNGSTNPVDKAILLNSFGSATIRFIDTDVKKGHIYKYSCKLIYKDGTTVVASNTPIVEFSPENNNIINVRLENLNVTQLENNVDVSFNIITDFILSNEDKIKAALDLQDLSRYFDGSVSQDKLQNLVGHRVLRQNMSSGELEDFGTVLAKTFTDSAQGTICGAKPLEDGNEYTYFVFSHFRKPESMLGDYVKNVTFDNFPNMDYSYKPSKWQNPITLEKGNLISDNSLKRNYSKDKFSIGPVGKISSISVTLSKTLPTIFKGVATKANDKTIKLQWRVQGTISKIDHFIITVEILGNKSIVGKSHNISDSGLFQFVDVLDSGEKGMLNYYVTPVYFDYTRGVDYKMNRVFV